MASNHRPMNNADRVPNAIDMSFAIVVSEWNPEITEALLEGCYNTLIRHGVLPNNIVIKHVPGSFELILGAQLLAENTDANAVICLGCVIQGDTPHFEYICQGVTQGITQLNLHYNMPFVYGILTVNNYEQARDRAGGRLGNKGEESALVAIKMVDLQHQLEGEE